MNSRLRELVRVGCPARDLDFYSCPQGGKGSAPPAPDYVGAAREQGAANKEAAVVNTWANRPEQFTPWGSTNWEAKQVRDPGTGQMVTRWTQRQSLDPQLQGALDSQIALQGGRSDLAQDFMGRVQNDFQQPFDWQNLPEMAGPGRTDEAGFAAEREQYTNAAFDQMRPEHQRQEEATRTRLANQGLTPGSQAYNMELERLGGVQAQERWNAVNQGGIEQQRMNQQLIARQGLQNSLRQQAIAEQAQRRGMSLNEMNALLTGQQVGSLQMPSFATSQGYQPGNFQQAAGQVGSYNLQSQMMQDQANAGLWGGVGQLAGTGALLYGLGAFSDERLKENVVRVGIHPIGVGIYEYDLFGRRERGVMAQEVLAVAPELVGISPSGYLTVDYGRL